MAWPLINQIFQILILSYVFSVIFKPKAPIPGRPETTLDFAIWLFAGTISWNATMQSLPASAGSIFAQSNLVKKVVFPLHLLPLVPIFSNFVESLIGLSVALAATLVIYGKLSLTVFALPFVMIPQLIFASSLAYALSALTVFVRDIPQGLNLVIQIWFYLTPMIYPLSMVPEALRPFVLFLNPMAAIVESYRGLILRGEFPEAGPLLALYGVSFALLILSLGLFKRLRPGFADAL